MQSSNLTTLDFRAFSQFSSCCGLCVLRPQITTMSFVEGGYFTYKSVPQTGAEQCHRFEVWKKDSRLTLISLSQALVNLGMFCFVCLFCLFFKPLFIYLAALKWSRSVMSDSLRIHGLSHSSIRGIFQARALEWVAISFSRASSQPRDWI